LAIDLHTEELTERAEARLALLRTEFEAGERRLAELDRQRAQLTETMLRISGAIQVLEEVLGRPALDQPDDDGDVMGGS
jgi:hypothetical protein